MITVNNLTKDYNNVGNFNVSIKLDEGQAYGIFGSNGAGKTTLIKQILGFIKPDSGKVTIKGMEPFGNSEKIMDFVGYVPGEISLYNDFSGFAYLKMVARIKKNVDWNYVEKLFDFFALDPNKKIKKMSKGMKQKIAIISAIMHKPSLLILDEPTSGLDAASINQFNELIWKLKKDFGITIFICSHMFDDIVKICDYIGFMSKGKIVKEYETKNITHEKIKLDFISEYTKMNVEDLLDEFK